MRKNALIVALLLIAGPAMAETISGEARVKDGDSLVVAGVEIRMQGIDAPEWSQTCTNKTDGHEWSCGRAARRHLSELIDGRPVRCERVDTDKYGRTVALCHAGRTNLNRRMVGDGWAFAYLKYSDDFAADERRARAKGLGFWDSEIMPPWDWRKLHPRKPAQPLQR